MLFVGDAGGEVDLVRVAVGTAVAWLERPKVADLDRLPVGAVELAEEVIVFRIVDVDRPIAEVADKKVM